MRNLAAAAAAAMVVGAAAGAPAVFAHAPGTDGGPAQRGCAPVHGQSVYVGATGVSCSVARQVASGSVRGQRFSRWRCTGVGNTFGHCHGRGIRAGAVVHWAVND